MKYQTGGNSGYRLGGINLGAASASLQAEGKAWESVAQLGNTMAGIGADLVAKEHQMQDDDAFWGGSKRLQELGNDVLKRSIGREEQYPELIKGMREAVAEDEPVFHSPEVDQKFRQSREDFFLKLTDTLETNRQRAVAARARAGFEDNLEAAMDSGDAELIEKVVRGGVGVHIKPSRGARLIDQAYQEAQFRQASKEVEQNPEDFVANFNEGKYSRLNQTQLAALSRSLAGGWVPTTVTPLPGAGAGDLVAYGMGETDDAEADDASVAGGNGSFSLSGGLAAGRAKNGGAVGGGGAGRKKGAIRSGVASPVADVLRYGEFTGVMPSVEELNTTAWSEAETVDVSRFRRDQGTMGLEWMNWKAGREAEWAAAGVPKEVRDTLFKRVEQRIVPAVKSVEWAGVYDFCKQNNLFNKKDYKTSYLTTPAGQRSSFIEGIGDCYVRKETNNPDAVKQAAENESVLRQYMTAYEESHPEASAVDKLQAFKAKHRQLTGKDFPMLDYLQNTTARAAEQNRGEVLAELSRAEEAAAQLKKVKKQRLAVDEAVRDRLETTLSVPRARLTVSDVAEEVVVIGEDLLRDNPQFEKMGVPDVALKLPDGRVYRPAGVKIVPGAAIGLGRAAAVKLRVLKGQYLNCPMELKFRRTNHENN